MKETPNLKLKIPEENDAVDNPYYFGDAFNKLDKAVASIVVIPKGTDIPTSKRKAGSFYLKVTDTQSGGMAENIRVSPKMGIILE